MFWVITIHSVDFLYHTPETGVSSFVSLVVEACTSFYLLNCIAHVWQVIWVFIKRFKLSLFGFGRQDKREQ